MFSIVHDNWTRPYQSRCPQMQGLRATDTSSLARQITNSSAHSFYTARSSGQIQFWIFSIGSEMVDPSEELANDHAYDAQFCGLANQMPQLFEHGFQMGTVGEFERLAGKLVERFAQGSASQPAIAPASAALQSADEMEMAELHDPALAGAEPDNSRNLVGDRGQDASVYVSGDRGEGLRPAPQVLPARQEHRIEEDSSIVVARLDRHQIQDPVFASKAEVNSVQEQNQRPCRHAQKARLGHKPPQGLTTTVPHRLRCKTRAWRQTLQGSTLYQEHFQKLGRTSPTLAASPFLADSPRSLAVTALATSRTEVINLCFATGRFRVRGMHARELATVSYLKYAKSQTNYV